jgi:N-methylhydantoinase A/oxoprolinase/acetone carboxylase beta subunit
LDKPLKPDRTLTEALVLGIDTGGTYTDGVLLEYHSRQVIASHKSLTTKRDFSIGIERVIEGIDIQNPSEIRMVSVSTTLATNAIAEGKGKRVALILIGYDPELIASFGMESRFATPDYYYFRGGHDLHGRQQAELDLSGILAKVNQIKDDTDAIAVSSYFSPLNPEHENRVYEAISSVCDLPVVMGHQLSTKLGSVERATTAALNASLLTVLQDFIIAVRRAMERRGIEAPLMVVRGDGTLMSDEFAARTPVETIHSGPAASSIGGRFLSGLEDALVVDIGGTTTDFALINQGQVDISEEGAIVADYKTAVKAANLLSIGLGGDSHIRINRQKSISIGPQRVVPLSYLADQHTQVHNRLKVIGKRIWAQSGSDWIEFWFLIRDPKDERIALGENGKRLIKLLQSGPQPVPEILQALNLLHAAQLGVEDLLRQEIIGRAGLTPTDLLHIEGRYSPWNVEAAEIAREVVCRQLLLNPEEFNQIIWARMTETIMSAVVSFLINKRVSDFHQLENDLGAWFFRNSLYQDHPQLETLIRLRQPIIGIGAPADIFLRQVAEKFHTELILPRHYQVANAVGAIAGSVMVTEEILVYPHLTGDGMDVIGYYVQASQERMEYENLAEALKYSRKLSREKAFSAALRSGADSPHVRIDEWADGIDTYRVRARAVGNPRLAK